jgi:hypothetical protein
VGGVNQHREERWERALVDKLTGWGNDNTLEVVIADGGGPVVPLSKPAAAGVQGGIPAVAWISDQGIEVQFFSSLGEPTTPGEEVFSKVLVSEGAGKSNVQIADALAAFGVAWEEGAPGTGVIKLRAVPAEGLPIGEEVTVGSVGFNNHSMSISGYDFATNVTIPDPTDPGDTIDVAASGINVAWVASVGDSDFGRIMLQRYQIVPNEAGDPASLRAAGLDGLKGHRAVGGMRASIYNAMPIEGVRALVEYMKAFEQRHG